MSSRPRPVTATVTKPGWMEIPDAEAVANARRYSLDSTGSTASLTSILDHNSYVSVPSEDEQDKLPQHVKEDFHKEGGWESKKSVQRQRGHKSGWEEKIITSQTSEEKGLSPWELWLIAKTKEERQKRKAVQKKKKEQKLEKQKSDEEKQFKLQKAERVLHDWVESKNYEEKLRRKLEKQRIRNEKVLKQEKQQEVEEKSEVKFKEWALAKKKEEREKKRIEKQKKENEEEDRNKREELAKKKFQEWFKEAQRRPRSAPNSYGYISGKLTGYHDRGAYPSPSFYNPVPWQPIPIPKVKTEKPKRSKPKKYIWNPAKYF